MAGPKSPLQRGREKLVRNHSHLVKIGAFKNQWLAGYAHRLLSATADARLPEDATQIDGWKPKANGITWLVQQLGPDEDQVNIRRSVVKALDYLARLGLLDVADKYETIRFAAVDRDSKSVVDLEQKAAWRRDRPAMTTAPAREPKRRTVAVRQTDVADEIA
jgi:hypothetical protein